MSIYIETKVKKMFVGSAKAKKVYLGNALVWVGTVQIAVPTVSANPTYTGSAVSPTWSGYDSTKMTIGGTTSSINAGNYTATFTPKEGFSWDESGEDVAPRSVTWSIGRASVGAKPPATVSKQENGFVQSNGYTSPSGVSVSGATSGESKGTYVATYTPDSNHKWSDNTTSSATLTLEIIMSEFLFFKADENTDISWVASETLDTTPNLQYSLNGTSNWTNYTLRKTISLAKDNTCYWKGTTTTFSNSGTKYIKFSSTGRIYAYGNINSLVNKITTLDNYCYFRLFQSCTNLITAPALPATTLGASCYSRMFEGCTNLITAPELPATTLADLCYELMFSGCTSLVAAPTLPATTLTGNCYSQMFKGCTNLITAPSLPAISLVHDCYSQMFSGCTSLSKPPALPATELPSNCYYKMFYGCTGIKLSSSQDSTYRTPYRIPTSGTGSGSGSPTSNMFTSTGGTFKGMPSINTTYYGAW